MRVAAVMHQVWSNTSAAPCFWYDLGKLRKCEGNPSPLPLQLCPLCCRYHSRCTGNGRLHRGHPLPAPHLAPDLQAETSRQQQTYVPSLASCWRGYPSHLLGCASVVFMGEDVSRWDQLGTT